MLNKLVISTICLVTLLACGGPAEGPDEEQVVIRPVKVIRASADERIRVVRLPAIVGAADNSILTFQVSGLLQQLQISEGQEVTRGQVLATLDQRDFRNSVNSAQAQFDNAQTELERAQRLIDENAIARSVLDQRRSARDVASASLDSARKRLDDTVIRAPFSGVVADIHVESFETIGAQQPVLTLQSAGDAEAIVQVPASLIINIQQLEPIETFLELDAAPGVRLASTFVESSSAADPTTQTFESRFSFTPPEELLILPGMTGLLTGTFRTNVTEDIGGIVIPGSAIIAEAGETYVWIVDEESLTVSRRDIDVSSGVGEGIRVIDGLQEGELIVGAGGPYLTEGAEIRIYEN